MTEKKRSEIAADERRARQEDMLKANLKRRKEQARARRKPESAIETDEEQSAEDGATGDDVSQ